LQSPAIYTVPTPGFRGPPGTPGYPPTNDPQRPKLVLPGGSRPELISRQTHLFNRWKAGNLAELITTQDIPQRVLPQESTPGGGVRPKIKLMHTTSLDASQTREKLIELTK